MIYDCLISPGRLGAIGEQLGVNMIHNSPQAVQLYLLYVDARHAGYYMPHYPDVWHADLVPRQPVFGMCAEGCKSPRPFSLGQVFEEAC